jgi:hypothetical protein
VVVCGRSIVECLGSVTGKLSYFYLYLYRERERESCEMIQIKQDISQKCLSFFFFCEK